MEHRWGTRAPIEMTVELRRPGGRRTGGRTSNVSMSGASIRTTDDLPCLTPIEVHVRGETVPAWIVRRMPGAIAVEWCEFAPAPIAALLRRRSPGPGTQSRAQIRVEPAWSASSALTASSHSSR